MDLGDEARRALQETGQDEAVEVNQRALIDKILARYAAEFSSIRELLQNADDAGATCCELRFETVKTSSPPSPSTSQPSPSSESSLPTVNTPDLASLLGRWVFKNDGKPFTQQDWTRLRRIAEGNPDPDRIGAFGVGFYSLFSVCDEPIVSSGGELMGFFWKGDALYTRRAKTSAGDNELSPEGKTWTTFFMPLREPAPFPESPLELARFLATSLTFTSNLRRVRLCFDDVELASLTKALAPASTISIPSSIKTTSPQKVLSVKSMASTPMQIDLSVLPLILPKPVKDVQINFKSIAALTKSGGTFASMLSSAFGRKTEKRDEKLDKTDKTPEPPEDPVDLLKAVKAAAHLRIASASVKVSVDKTLSRELERATKKPPPSNTAVQLIFTTRDEYTASGYGDEEQKQATKDRDPKAVFEGLIPKLESQGRVFIGFRTHQTTSISGHLAARFIPTVERESLDFIDRFVAAWNNELLYIAGVVARTVYEDEVQTVARLWQETVTGDSSQSEGPKEWLQQRALHTLRFFTCRTSTPSPRVSQAIESTFFSCSRHSVLPLMSSAGIKPSSEVRFPNEQLSAFLKELPIIPPAHVEAAHDMMIQLRQRNLVSDITLTDVFSELSKRPLSLDETVALFRWWIELSGQVGFESSWRQKLVENAIVALPDDRLQPLSMVTQYLNPKHIPTDVPLPSTCLYYDVTKHFAPQDLTRVFGFVELSLVEWMQHLRELSAPSSSTTSTSSSLTNIQLSPAFAVKVLLILARAWPSLPAHRQQSLKEIMQGLTCVPTKQGMHKPQDAYFSMVDLFPDLPIVYFPTAPVKGNLEKLLAALGVRKHVELQLVFSRLIGAGEWSHIDLLQYLAKVKDTLSANEMDRLRKTAIFPKEGEPKGSPGPSGRPRTIRYRASELFEPTASLRKLGLPLIDWTGIKPWKPTSEEANFCFSLGLLRIPPLDQILNLASHPSNSSLRTTALEFFFEHYHTHYENEYSPKSAASFAFVPALVGDDTKAQLKPPTDVFTNSAARIMRWPIVDTLISSVDVTKLKLRLDPPASQLIERLVNSPPREHDLARKVFEYLAGVQSFNLNDYQLLRDASFIPVTSKDKKAQDGVVFVPPSAAYFASTSSGTPQFAEIFSYIDFGPIAGSFLQNCGVRNEPSIDEVAQALVREPRRFFTLAGGSEKYCGILRSIAASWTVLKAPLRSEMKRSAFLLGSRRVASSDGTANAEDDEDDDQSPLEYSLRLASEIVVGDDPSSSQLFASSLFFAPHEDILTELYERLGSPRLSSLVKERYDVLGAPRGGVPLAEEVKARVLERTPLFLLEKKRAGRSEVLREVDWLKRSLQVLVVGGRGLHLTRELRFGKVHATNAQVVSATASLKEGILLLYISEIIEVDWFEVAMSLSKFLVARQRLPEILLFEKLLSTSLRNLKRRGFHVDRILAQRRADRDAAEQRIREERLAAEMEKVEPKGPSQSELHDYKQRLLSAFPDADPAFIDAQLAGEKEDHVRRISDRMIGDPSYPKRPQVAPTIPADRPGGNPFPMTGGTSFLQSFKRRFGGSLAQAQTQDGRRSSISEKEPNIPGAWENEGRPTPSRHSHSQNDSQLETTFPRPPRLPDSSAHVTPQSDIRRNVLRAIQASKPENTSLVQSQGLVKEVSESKSSYCDAGAATDLRLAGEVRGLKFYVSNDETDDALSRHSEALGRLIDHVYKPVASIFGLDPRCISVFLDRAGPLIAFNRAGHIYLNLRYYLAWHDEEVKTGQLTNALISVWSSVAHELAHNIVAEHNSEHEFYYSSLCEYTFLPLSKHLASLSQ